MGTMRARIAIAAASALALVATSGSLAGVKVKQDPEVDLSVYSSYAWEKGLPAAREEIQKTIVAAVERELAAKGLAPDAQAPQLYVVTYALGEDMASVVNGFYRAPNWAWGVITTDARVVVRGTLVVDLVDAAEDKLVWRAVAEENVTDAEQARRKVEQVVKKMFGKLRRR